MICVFSLSVCIFSYFFFFFFCLFLFFVFFFFFFFFQAEDGIRDGTVTGVQTCALPISLELRVLRLELLHSLELRDAHPAVLRSPVEVGGTANPVLPRQLAQRSEERRVGKECRSRWAAYD